MRILLLVARLLREGHSDDNDGRTGEAEYGAHLSVRGVTIGAGDFNVEK
jgi:hypothetical protein